MMWAHDDVVLTDDERQTFARLETSLRDAPTPLPQRPSSPWRDPRRRLTAGAALFVVGLVVLVATFAASLWAGAAGVALMGAGAWLQLDALRRLLLDVHAPGRPARRG